MCNSPLGFPHQISYHRRCPVYVHPPIWRQHQLLLPDQPYWAGGPVYKNHSFYWSDCPNLSQQTTTKLSTLNSRDSRQDVRRDKKWNLVSCPVAAGGGVSVSAVHLFTVKPPPAPPIWLCKHLKLTSSIFKPNLWYLKSNQMTQKYTSRRAVQNQIYKVKPSLAPPFWLRGHYWQARKCRASTTFNVRISNHYFS